MSGIAEMSPKYLAEAASNADLIGYKQTEAGDIPLDWECHNFGDLVDYKKGYAFKSEQYGETGTRIIRVSDTSYADIKDESPIFISDKLAKLYQAWSLRESDLIFSTVGSKPPMYDSLVGKAIYVTKKHEGSLLNQNAVRIRAKSKTEGIQALLLNHFRTERYIDFIEVIYRGNANQASITLENLFEFKIPLPSVEKEQTAIANALSDVDALISELEKLIAKKQAIKTATMQQLLTGRTRLPQFALREDGTPKGTKPSELGEIPEDWEVFTFADVISFLSSGATPYRGNKSFYKGTIRWITSGELNYCVINDTLEKISDEAVLKTNLKIHPAGTFLMAITGLEAAGTRGACGIVGQPSATNQSCMAIYPNEKLMTQYLYFWYVYNGEELAFKYCQGTKQLSYTAGLIKKIPIYLPCDTREQTAIATILSDMDAEIQALEQRLGKTRQIKQGMMQELLTGKTRLIKPSKEVIHE
ncbi:restriction endonuclease subunit S [Vibrio cidicii]|uniref:restriction endonuclease subunit S n=1 Tax=Vibrio cidicii TaxID=1763883 RepID=UPI000ADEF2E0|nr:restriction endonuclease subunit S [Vibrio cidicii]ELV8625810.1 restriction endonuclease subunit S [Vibrio cidicii]